MDSNFDRSLVPAEPEVVSPSDCAPRRVEILAFPRVQILDVTGPLQVFATANKVLAEAGSPPAYDPVILANSDHGVSASAGVNLGAEALPAFETPVDTLLVSGGEGVDDACTDQVLLKWLIARSSQARRVGSVCTGAILLGAAGLLDGRRAVTHWKFCDELAARFPSANVEKEPIFIRDGRLWTSAGVTTGIDLALALVEQDLGRTIALACARYLVVYLKRPGSQAQFSAMLSTQTPNERFDALNAWMRDNLGQDLSLPALARRAGMSERSLSRHYRSQTGMTPARAVERLRVEAACMLLLETDLPVKLIAGRCGFQSEETMRRSFIRVLDVPPSSYRELFSTTTYSADRDPRPAAS